LVTPNSSAKSVSSVISFAKNFSDQIIFLADGKIHEIDAPEQFFKMPQTIRAQNFLAKLLS
jgi:ABC-type histidine transport system ATPase subunit